MPVQKNVMCKSYEAEGTIGQYEPVKFGTAEGTVVVCSADSDLCIGIAQIDGIVGDEMSIAFEGSVLMRVGATSAPTKGSLVGLDTADPTEIMIYGSTPNNQVIGICETVNTVNKLALVNLQFSNKTA